MKGFSIPSFSIPKISIPNISFSEGSVNTNIGSIKTAVTSAIPDLSNLTRGVDLQGAASNLLSEQIGEGIDIPSELSDLLK